MNITKHIVHFENLEESSWREVLSVDNEHSLLQIFIDSETNDVDIVQTSDEGEALSSTIHKQDVKRLVQAIKVAAFDKHDIDTLLQSLTYAELCNFQLELKRRLEIHANSW